MLHRLYAKQIERNKKQRVLQDELYIGRSSASGMYVLLDGKA